jgi:hypothetical protein
MHRQKPLHASLELEPGAGPPRGALIVGRCRSERFSGWIELASAIEAWRGEAEPLRDHPRRSPRREGEARAEEGLD